MRRYRIFAAGLLALAALMAAAEPSLAESFLQRLFGFGVREPEYPLDRREDETFGSDRFGAEAWPEDYGSYRTVCVRLCDGFYFPLSEGVRRERLRPDANMCTQRCDSDARLFYYPTNGGSPETMVDLAGQRYSALPNAFLYRKKLVDGCSCKPAPWSPQEAARHQSYALEAAAQKAAGGDETDDRTAAATPQSAARDERPPVRTYQRRSYRAWPTFSWGSARFGWR